MAVVLLQLPAGEGVVGHRGPDHPVLSATDLLTLSARHWTGPARL